MNILLKAERICGGYGKETVIDDISLCLKAGSFLGIIGPNGSGKSTLLRMISRTMHPTQGRVELDGDDIYRMGSKEFSRRVAFVSQDTAINFSFTVWEIVLMGRIPHLGRMESEKRADISIAEEALASTDTLHLKDKEIDSLSAGERQRVVIARALAQKPTLLYLDEPTSHLDIGHQIRILDLLKKLNREEALTIVIVLHDLNLAGEYCERIALIDKGRIYREGSPDEVLTYQNIEAVYKTVVVVNSNPISSKPFITLVSGDQRCRRG